MRHKIYIASFIVVYLLFFVTYFHNGDALTSKEERRKLTTLKDVQSLSVTDPLFSQEMEHYLLDQIPFRNNLKTLKAKITYDVFKQKDNHHLYFQNNHWFKKTKPYQENKTKAWVSMIQQLQQEYKMATPHTILIPDKNYYLNKSDYLPIVDALNKENISYLDVAPHLSLNDYYYGDPHLKQEGYLHLLALLEEKLSLPHFQQKLEKHEYTPFYGAYSGQGLYPATKEGINYYTNAQLANAQVHYLENKEEHQIYVEANLDNMDAYDVFLDGASAFIHIQNNESLTSKNVIVFRDSYGSSFSSLLPLYYQNVYVVDLRYIKYQEAKQLLPSIIDDILFIYGEISVQQLTHKIL